MVSCPFLYFSVVNLQDSSQIHFLVLINWHGIHLQVKAYYVQWCNVKSTWRVCRKLLTYKDILWNRSGSSRESFPIVHLLWSLMITIHLSQVFVPAYSPWLLQQVIEKVFPINNTWNVDWKYAMLNHFRKIYFLQRALHILGQTAEVRTH